MIKGKDFWLDWEATTILSQPPDYYQNLRLLEGMYEHARNLGVYPPTDPLEGLESIIRVAIVLNTLTTPGITRPSRGQT